MRYILAFCLLLAVTVPVTWGQQSEDLLVFGRSYSELRPGQETLIDDWFARFAKTMNRDVDTATEYDRVPVSYRTTYEAVTHALMTAELTSSSGEPLGAPIDLIERLDAVHGKIKGAGGDRQFRIYVTLKPDALETLKESREFSRGMDNTVFHKGYPINYRQQGGVPSIQFSISKDGTRADIDVDYRSSKIPVALFNGHLTASNSDVRAGPNYDRHVNRWQGLDNWWRSLFGLPMRDLLEASGDEEDIDVANQPIKKLPKVQDAVHDFFNLWLVEQNPAHAIGYITDGCYDCVELEQGSDIDRGMIRFLILRGMMQANDQMGEVASLNEASIGVRLTNTALRVVDQPHHASFVLFEVPDDVAATFLCSNRLHPEEAAKKKAKRRYGNYYGAVVSLKSRDGRTGTLATLWAKSGGYWRMVSYESEPGVEDEIAQEMQLHEEVAPAAAKEYVKPPKGFVSANHKFLEQWLVKHQPEKAVEYFDTQCYPCYNLFRKDDEAEVHGEDEARAALRDALAKANAVLGRPGKLADVIEPVEPRHEHVKHVRHQHDGVYTLGGIPNYMAEAADCARRLEGHDHAGGPDDPEHGKFYASGFRLKEVFGNPSVLHLVWENKPDGWKIIAYDILTP